MTTLADTIAATLAEHWEMDKNLTSVLDIDAWECSCGYGLGDSTGDLEGRFRAHVATVLAEQEAQRRKAERGGAHR